MKSLSIPYPKDKDNLKGKLADKEKAEVSVLTRQFNRIMFFCHSDKQ